MAYSIKTPKGEFTLAREEFVDIGISLLMPEYFKDLSEKERTENIPHSQQPAVIKSNKEYSAFFTLHYTKINQQKKAEKEAFVIELFSKQQQIISNHTPGFSCSEAIIKRIDEHIVICQEYTSQSLDTVLHNIFFLLVHGGKMIYGTFSCLLDDASEMNIVFSICLNSLQVIASKEQA